MSTDTRLRIDSAAIETTLENAAAADPGRVREILAKAGTWRGWTPTRWPSWAPSATPNCWANCSTPPAT